MCLGPPHSQRPRSQILVMLLDAPSCGFPTLSATSEAAIRTAYLGPNLDGLGGIAGRAENCS